MEKNQPKGRVHFQMLSQRFPLKPLFADLSAPKITGF